MKKLLLVAVLSLAAVACDKHEKPIATTTPGHNTVHPVQIDQDNDNTGKNVRDRDESARTPLDQSENAADRTITQKIRQAIIADDSLSMNAKNIKIITLNGVVTLRGPVASAMEKDNIARKVSEVAGILKVDNQLEITQNH